MNKQDIYNYLKENNIWHEKASLLAQAGCSVSH